MIDFILEKILLSEPIKQRISILKNRKRKLHG